ncbi:hypothetical protein CB0940_05002 [Cercospora beticola]|uniref:Uncharacterized protein n=1 Tax=Cercospora beticola TaxID=122368 RepID=A0A2G5HLX3_CERBT|nr:hypothetical protein CB0940_05002 [Cercospora beticola]PIA93530.1 hypothetical protein CB0940_05002 [Cercospora beticola]WPB02290.1 hypothetical protein RHO25_006924 [Cercospora beticola]
MVLTTEQKEEQAKEDAWSMASVAHFIDHKEDDPTVKGVEDALGTVSIDYDLGGIGVPYGVDLWPHDGQSLRKLVGVILSDTTRRAPEHRNLTAVQARSLFFQHGSDALSNAYRAQLATAIQPPRLVPLHGAQHSEPEFEDVASLENENLAGAQTERPSGRETRAQRSARLAAPVTALSQTAEPQQDIMRNANVVETALAQGASPDHGDDDQQPFQLAKSPPSNLVQPSNSDRTATYASDIRAATASSATQIASHAPQSTLGKRKRMDSRAEELKSKDIGNGRAKKTKVRTNAALQDEHAASMPSLTRDSIEPAASGAEHNPEIPSERTKQQPSRRKRAQNDETGSASRPLSSQPAKTGQVTAQIAAAEESALENTSLAYDGDAQPEVKLLPNVDKTRAKGMPASKAARDTQKRNLDHMVRVADGGEAKSLDQDDAVPLDNVVGYQPSTTIQPGLLVPTAKPSKRKRNGSHVLAKEGESTGIGPATKRQRTQASTTSTSNNVDTEPLPQKGLMQAATSGPNSAHGRLYGGGSGTHAKDIVPTGELQHDELRTRIANQTSTGDVEEENANDPDVDVADGIPANFRTNSKTLLTEIGGEISDTTIWTMELPTVLGTVDGCLQKALDIIFTDAAGRAVSTLALDPTEPLFNLYVVIFGKSWRSVSLNARAAEDQYDHTSSIPFSATNVLRCLIWHALTFEIMDKEQLDDAVYALIERAQTYLRTALSGREGAYHTLLRRSSKAQFTDPDFVDGTLMFHADETAYKLMALLEQHLDALSLPRRPQNWRMLFAKQLRQVCKLAFFLKARLAAEKTKTELWMYRYGTQIEGAPDGSEHGENDAPIVLLTRTPGIRKLGVDGSWQDVVDLEVEYCRPEMQHEECLFDAFKMPRKSKNQTGPSNRRAMRTILRHVDANLGTLTTKAHRLNWLKPLASSGKFPYTGTQEIGAYHNEDTLHEAITYAVRDAKKDEYKVLAGRRALDRFFELGSAMLTGEYLVAIGYTFLDDSGALHLRDETDALKDDSIRAAGRVGTAASIKTAKQLASGSKANDREKVLMEDLPNAQSTHKNDESSPTGTQNGASENAFEPPKHRPIDFQPDQHDGAHPAESPDIVYEPVPTSAGIKRKFVQFVDSDSRSSPENQMVLDPEKLDALRLWEDIERLTKTITELSRNLCTPAQTLKLNSSPSTSLESIYAHIFNTVDWRLACDHLVKYGEIKPSAFLQALFWIFLSLRVLESQHFPPGEDSKSPVPSNSGAALLASLTKYTEQYPRKEAIEHFYRSNTMTTVVQPHAKVLADELNAIVAEHLAVESSSPSSDAEVHNLLSSSIDTMQEICVKASILRGLIDISKGKYRLLKHLPGSDIYHRRELNSFQNTLSEIRRETIVAFTIAPGLERKLEDADTYTVVGPATIAELRK